METEGEMEAVEDRVEFERGEREDMEELKDSEEELGLIERGEMKAKTKMVAANR